MTDEMSADLWTALDKARSKAGNARDRAMEARDEEPYDPAFVDDKLDKYDAKLLEGQSWSAEARRLNGATIPEPGPGFMWECTLEGVDYGLPWGPLNRTEYKDWHKSEYPAFDPPQGVVKKSQVTLHMIGETIEQSDILNILGGWTNSKNSKGQWLQSEMLGYWLHKSNNWLKVRQGIPPVEGETTVHKPSLFEQETTLVHTVDYENGNHYGTWNGVEFQAHDPIGVFEIGPYGPYMTFGGAPASVHETSCEGVVCVAIDVKLWY